MAIVGLVESLLTAKIVDDYTNTYSNKNKEARGQGIANIITALFGGMGGCAMIGQSGINVRSGANSRLSTLTADYFNFHDYGAWPYSDTNTYASVSRYYGYGFYRNY